ncbi:tyrosine-type recombinase/integrase [Promicromonospora sp. NPDC052451]|uniref:tyrosine-type recombinase/integrase n=1 Tax=Promicromonospora sp. NPDC052451 TaxID=3364407 RepID=UPI0037CB9E9B
MASIKKRPNGKWRARYRDEAGHEHARHFDRKTDAQTWLDEVTATIVTGIYADPRAGRVTFQAYFKQWAARQVWVNGTDRAMALAVASTTFTDTPMKSVQRSHIEGWIKKMTTDGLAPGTVKTRYNNVRSVFRAAVRDKIIGTDPTTGVTLPRMRRTEHALTIPTAEQVGKLIASAESPFKPFIALCAFAGLRLGEAAGVKVGDIDFLGRTLHVTRQIQRENGRKIEIRPPKYGSERDVYIPDELTTMLSAHIKKHGTHGDGWLFVGAGDDPPHQNTVGYRWRTTVAKAKVTGFTLHDLRHFYASGLIAENCDVVTVQRALGHASATTTLRTYAHLWPTAEDRTRRAAGSLMQTALAPTADSSRTAKA